MSTFILGGTAAYHLDFSARVNVEREERFVTPYGVAGPVLFFRVGDEECAFLSRHGGDGRLGVTPPFINYHANLYVGRLIGASRVLSWNSAGALTPALEPGSIAVIADLIDWTRARRPTFGPELAGRLPVTGPLFAPALRQKLVGAAAGTGKYVAARAIYAATEGARLETAAEIRLLAQAGATVVGMTMAPEVFLARELGMAYGSLCWISNYATGVPFDPPERRLFGAEVGPMMLDIILKLLQEEAKGHGR